MSSEIQVFSVKLKGDSIDDSVLKAIDLAIPFPFYLRYGLLVVSKATMQLAISVRQRTISPNGFVAVICAQKRSI